MASDDEISLLVIVVDVNPIWWGQQAQRESEFTLSKCLDSVMVLGNSHMAMARTNKLAVIASHCQDSHFLYPSNKLQGGENGEENTSCSGDGKYELLSIANNSIAEEMRNLMLKTEVRGNSNDTLLAGSLAKALCYINRVSKEMEVGQETKSRILVIKAAEDCALQYMNFMNVIFAAQKQNILIDACVLDTDSGLLQQVFGFPLVSPSRIIEDTTLGSQPSLFYRLVILLEDCTSRYHRKLPWHSTSCGCSCLTPSSARSCCCRHAHTWTTGLRVSAIETSSRSVTCAPFVYQFSATSAPSAPPARLPSKSSYLRWSSPKRKKSNCDAVL